MYTIIDKFANIFKSINFGYREMYIHCKVMKFYIDLNNTIQDVPFKILDLCMFKVLENVDAFMNIQYKVMANG